MGVVDIVNVLGDLGEGSWIFEVWIVYKNRNVLNMEIVLAF